MELKKSLNLAALSDMLLIGQFYGLRVTRQSAITSEYAAIRELARISLLWGL